MGDYDDGTEEDRGRTFDFVKPKARFLVHKALLHLRRALVRRGYDVDKGEENPIFRGEAEAKGCEFGGERNGDNPAFVGVLPQDPDPSKPAAFCGLLPGDTVWVVLHLTSKCNTKRVKEIVPEAAARGATRVIIVTHEALNNRVLLFLENGEGEITGESFLVKELAPDVSTHSRVPIHTPLPPSHPEAKANKEKALTISTDCPQIKLLGLVPGVVVRMTYRGLTLPLCTTYRITALPDTVRFKTAAFLTK